MSTPLERILVVESDPNESDLIARQVLQPLGYRTKIVSGAPSAIQETTRFSPDITIVNLNLPDLSGKDLLVALSSQGSDVPVIVIAEEGDEANVIQAFRLGATDFLKSPLREAEIVSAVERVLKQVRAKRERRLLAHKLEKTNRELNRRVRDLTTIFGIGKAVTSITDQQVLFDRIVDGAVSVTDADKGWLHLRKEDSKKFTLRAVKNLPKSISSAILGEEWDDGISSLVALSGETFSITGEPLKKFKVSQLGKSTLVVPVKAQDEVIGLLVVLRDKAIPFDPGNQFMLEAVADYVSVSLVNARLFRALAKQARALESSADATSESAMRLSNEMVNNVSNVFQIPYSEVEQQIDLILNGNSEGITDGQQDALSKLRSNLRLH
ncbi:MAG: response regulator [Anaerolineales bacterium]|nr:response regulator [Chloroflexota bacterium]MBL6981769.1 response regulator [Anaerolineales bacterium]